MVSRIEYFSAGGEVVTAVEINNYKKLPDGFSVPTDIEIINYINDKKDKFRLALDLVKPAEFSRRQIEDIFERPKPRGYEHVYEIAGGKLFEQQ